MKQLFFIRDIRFRKTSELDGRLKWWYSSQFSKRILSRKEVNKIGLFINCLLKRCY